MNLTILFHDQDLVVVEKPSGMLVHRSRIAISTNQSVLQVLRNQIQQSVYPVHRLDRPTSGVLIFALSKESANRLCKQFAESRVEKKYLAVVRGYVNSEVDVDYPLLKQSNSEGFALEKSSQCAQNAFTRIRPIAKAEIPFSIDRYPSSRFTLIEALPRTGRNHQIRRHLKHLHHPIIGDRNYGQGKYNRFFAETFKARGLLLTCRETTIRHPTDDRLLNFKAGLSSEFSNVMRQLGWETHLG